MSDTTNIDSAENQSIKSRFVDREVIYCVSDLVSELATAVECFPDCEDDLQNAFRGLPDYNKAINEEVLSWSREQCAEELYSWWGIKCKDDDIENMRNLFLVKIDEQGPDEFCYGLDVSDYERKVYEHWIVTDHLADRLEERGERVLRDFFGLTVWCRTTTDQPIDMDRVIHDICNGMEILVGQANAGTSKMVV